MCCNGKGSWWHLQINGPGRGVLPWPPAKPLVPDPYRYEVQDYCLNPSFKTGGGSHHHCWLGRRARGVLAAFVRTDIVWGLHERLPHVLGIKSPAALYIVENSTAVARGVVCTATHPTQHLQYLTNNYLSENPQRVNGRQSFTQDVGLCAALHVTEPSKACARGQIPDAWLTLILVQ